MTEPTAKREHAYTIRELVLFGSLGMQLAALVWGAATIKNTLDGVVTKVNDIQTTIDVLEQTTSDIAVLKYRLEQAELRLREPTRR